MRFLKINKTMSVATQKPFSLTWISYFDTSICRMIFVTKHTFFRKTLVLEYNTDDEYLFGDVSLLIPSTEIERSLASKSPCKILSIFGNSQMSFSNVFAILYRKLDGSFQLIMTPIRLRNH